MKRLIEVASSEIGVSEIPGEEDRSRILQYAEEGGLEGVTADETPWCSIFMNWIATRAGVERTGKANARSWLNAGLPVEQPEPGDTVVFWRESPDSWKGHVGLFMGYSRDASRVYVLGGNQDDRVGVSAYPSDRVLGFRRLRPLEQLALPDPDLERGDRGEAVVALQDGLKLAGFDAGTSDGIYGPRTEAAVRSLQTTGDGLDITGRYDEATRDHLRSIVADRTG